MNKTIWKFPLKMEDSQYVRMPIGAEMLTVQIQNEEPFLWALVDPTAENESRYIEIFGTGNPVNFDPRGTIRYISTFQMKGGKLVFHAFEYIFTIV